MVSEDELFVSFDPHEYRATKSNILMSEADLLSVLKRLNNLSILARQKRDLKIRLNKLLTSVSSEIVVMKDKIPTPKIPKIIQKKGEKEVETKVTFKMRDDIDEELRLIQDKLKKLNSFN